MLFSSDDSSSSSTGKLKDIRNFLANDAMMLTIIFTRNIVIATTAYISSPWTISIMLSFPFFHSSEDSDADVSAERMAMIRGHVTLSDTQIGPYSTSPDEVERQETVFCNEVRIVSSQKRTNRGCVEKFGFSDNKCDTGS